MALNWVSCFVIASLISQIRTIETRSRKGEEEETVKVKMSAAQICLKLV